MSDACEAMIQKKVLAHLQQLAPRAFFYRTNTGGAQTVNADGSTGFIKFGIPGQADLTGVVAGQFVAIELKRRTGKQRATQSAYQARVEAAGGLYLIVRSVADINPIRELIR
jgi:hypothetical protein